MWEGYKQGWGRTRNKMWQSRRAQEFAAKSYKRSKQYCEYFKHNVYSFTANKSHCFIFSRWGWTPRKLNSLVMKLTLVNSNISNNRRLATTSFLKLLLYFVSVRMNSMDISLMLKSTLAEKNLSTDGRCSYKGKWPRWSWKVSWPMAPL